MILEALKVNNIRSIKKIDVQFPLTTILFYGDIGSGKSSILKAIEFGLFGTMGDLPAPSLLRRGQNSAKVELTFSIGGNHYTIHRELKRAVRNDKETISQSEGWLIENDTQTSYTTTELRTKILDILNYSTTKYKASNKKCVDLFRYTVYTPQEALKDILQSKPDERFEILKDVLEIEKYENTLSNLENIKKDLSRQIRDIEKDIKDIGSPEEFIPQIEKDIEVKKGDIKIKEGEIKAKKEVIEEEKNLLKSMQEEYINYTSKLSQITSKQESVKEEEERLKNNESSLEKLENEITEKQRELDGLPKKEKPSEKNEQELEEQIKSLRIKGEESSNNLSIWQQKLSDVEKLLIDGKCSLCGQAIHDKERFDAELKDAKENVSQLSRDREECKKLVNEYEQLLKDIHEFEKVDQNRNSIIGIIKEKEAREAELAEANKKLTTNIDKMKKDIKNALESYGLKSLEETEAHKDDLKKEQESQEEKVESINAEMIQLEKELTGHESDLKTIIKGLEDAKDAFKWKKLLNARLEYTNGVKTWVNEQFPVLLKDIERTILATTASQFNQYFKEWFRALVEEENIDIQIDPENFQPIVVVDGYDSPFEDLSGGERSALSLAYRLALNKVINTKHQDLKTKDLLILDEPTDGFSEAQVNKMQGVFDTLNMKQMIIISHERTLDSFVSQIVNFKKTNHQTKISIEDNI